MPEPPSELPAAWFRRGVALAELNNCERAIPALERGLGPGGETAAYWLERCYALEAERAAARIRALGNEAAFHRVRGGLLVRVKGDAQSATEDYENVRKLQPRAAVFAERLAHPSQRGGELRQAEQSRRE